MIYLFNNNEEMIRIIPNSAIKRMYQTQMLTDENYISDRLDVEMQALNDEELSELEYMAIDDIENSQWFHYYFIVKETTEHQITSLTGVQSGIEELRKTPVYDMRPTNLSPKLIADRLLEGTNWQTGYTTDDVGTISTNFYYTDVFSALKKMCMSFGIEMQFFVEITTNRIGARYIEFRKRTGKSVGKRVVYGHNALKIVKEVEKTNTITALIGRGKGVQVSESDEGNVGYGRKIGFENVEWNTSSGAPVDKPLGQEFVEIPDLTLQYGIKNSNGTVRPKIGFVEFQDEESETRLIDRTYNALLELSRPQVLLETSSVYLPDTGIGDTINVVRHDRDLRYQTRVFEITWDRLANQAVDMKLGDRLGESENKRISRISSQVSGNISTELGPTIDELVDRLTTADGKNTNWYTDYDPMENPETLGLVRVNDNWYQPDPEYEGEFILKQWNGEMWIEILRTSGNQELVRRFEEIEQQAQDLADDIEASDQKATEAKEEAGLAKSASESAEAIAQQAQAEAESANTNSSEALEKALLAGTDAETAKQNALDAVSQVGEAKQSASDALGQAGEAVIKANDAIGKANQIPQDIQSEIESKGLVSGSWVESHVDNVTGEINYALAEVSGSIPRVILGVVWDKSENPILTRTDYVEEYANLTDYLLKTNEIDYSIEGLSGHISRVETNKLDSTEFTSFKTNDYDVTVEGFSTALTDKLDEETFSAFKTNEFDVTVEGINGSIESLQTEKLDSADFNTFKSNDYELTVDGLRMDLSSVSGSIPTIIMGVEWDKSQNPELTRTDYLEYDSPNLYSPNFIMGVRWDKTGNPKLYRTDDTGGVGDYEHSQQTAQFVNDISGLSGRVESVETNKLGANEFNSFKTNTYDVDLSGLRTNITSLDENKLGSDEFSTFKTNVFDVSVSGLSGRIGTVETEKLDSETYETFKTNTYDVDVGGLKSRMSSVETEKLDSGTFNTFKDTTYANTIQGITGNISSLQQDKLDNQDFNSFKQNEYEVTVDGLKMGLTDVQGSFPTIVLGVEWDKSSDPKLTRTDYSEVGNPNLYAPSFIMGVMWDKKESPTMYRVADTGGVGDYEFTALQADYNFTKESWSTRLSQIENAGYATQTWSNQTFATPQSVTTQLQSYAKTTDLNGMVTETTLATKNYTTAGAVNTLLTSYAKTDNVPTATQFNLLKNRYDSMEQTIGTTNDSVARAVMTSSLWETEVTDEISGLNTSVSQLSDSWALNLKSGNDIKTQINASTDGIRLASKFIHLSGTSLIDDAVIKSAMIDTLDAGKITTGELNASLIRVVNLDASSITGNEANFIRAMFSGTYSTLQITGSGVRVLDNSGRSSTYLDSTGIEISREGINLGKMQYVTNVTETGDLNGMHGIVMRPNRNSYFAVSYFPTTGATGSVRRFAVSGQTGNVYIAGLIKPDESYPYGLRVTWGNITGRGSNVRLMNHDRTGGIQINNGDIFYLSTDGWISLNAWIR